MIDFKVDPNAKGLTNDALAASKKRREEFTKNPIYQGQHGCIPQSILIADRREMCTNRDLSLKKMGGSAGYQKVKAKNIDHSLGKTGMVTQGRKGSDSLSTFPQNIGRIVVDTYCPENGIVFDPHAGHNSRMELVYGMGRSYIGFDVSANFMEDNRKIAEYLSKGSGFIKRKNFIRLYEQSSHDTPIPSESCDFTLTSPPYWDIEYYGDEPEQLGNAETYERFLELLYCHVKENYRVLKPGSFVCYFINDFRKKAVFYSYHSDCIDLHKKAGFCHFNTYVVDLGWPINAAFANDVKARKLFPKRHEFCLVMKKPE